MSDWLDELHTAQRNTKEMGYVLSDIADGLDRAGIAPKLMQDLAYLAAISSEESARIGRAAGAAVNELYQSAREATGNVLAVALAMCEPKEGSDE